MRHMLLITLEYPPDKGGVANYYHGIVSHWPSFAPTSVGASEGGPNGELKVLHLKLGRFWPRWLPCLVTLIRECTRMTRIGELLAYLRHSHKNSHHSCHTLIQVGQALPLGVVALIIKLLKGIPYLVYTHGMDILLPQKTLRKKLILTLILRNASIIVANSNFTKNELLKLGVLEEKVIVIYPCPSLISHKSSVQSAGVSHLRNHRILLTVARLVKRKGIDTVIKALPEVLKVVPNLVYVVVGDGPCREELRELANQHAEVRPPKEVEPPKIIFTGSVSDDELISWYKRADVFIMVPQNPLTSAKSASYGDIEGFGTVYLEANSFGLPVIGSKTGGVPEAIEHGVSGLLVEPDNPIQTAEAIIKLLTSQELRSNLGEQGRKRAEKEFTWEKQIAKLVQKL